MKVAALKQPIHRKPKLLKIILRWLCMLLESCRFHLCHLGRLVRPWNSNPDWEAPVIVLILSSSSDMYFYWEVDFSHLLPKLSMRLGHQHSAYSLAFRVCHLGCSQRPFFQLTIPLLLPWNPAIPRRAPSSWG